MKSNSKRNRKKVLALLLALLLALSAAAAAEAPGAAAQAPTEAAEFVPVGPGARGEAVEDVEARLILLGYLSGEMELEYDAEVEAAVRAFQAEAGVERSGIVDEATWARLSAEDAPVNPKNPPEGERVWIPDLGEKYHRNWNCGNMTGPTCVTLEEAIARGYEPCANCYLQEEAE